MKIGFVTSLSGVYAALGENEIRGGEMATDEINAAGGILGQPLELLVEDDTSTTDVGVQKLRKLIERDNVNYSVGAVSSGVSLALSQVANQFGRLHIVSGGHADSITGSDCKWNTFRIPTNGNMEANAIGQVLADKFGKNWYITTPDYAYGWSLQEAFTRVNAELGGTIVGADRLPLGTNDYSAVLLKVAQAKPDVFLVFQAGEDAIAILTQITQFGLDKEMAVAGGLQEWENIVALPETARIGWWTFEWYYRQPDVPEVADFVERYNGLYNANPTARSWFGYVAIHSIALAAEAAGSLDSVAVAKALEGLTLPPEIGLQPGTLSYRAGDHQLMDNVYVGEVRQGDEPDDIFQVERTVPASESALPVSETGCTISYPG
ncbi:MAG TPA: ABC transporter substrate-binding protein [Trueperaceae bacterium]|nr:ABC transporter substrate-binding protein [Trueperaceae bacterium]